MSCGYVLSFSSGGLWCSQLRAVEMQRSSSKLFPSVRPLLIPKNQSICRLDTFLLDLRPFSLSRTISKCNGRPALRTPASNFVRSRCVRTTRSLQPSSQVRQEKAFEDPCEQQKEKQSKTPWHREGSDIAPVAREQTAGDMTKGGNYSDCRHYVN